MQTILLEDNLHEMLNPIFWEFFFKMSSGIFTEHAKL